MNTKLSFRRALLILMIVFFLIPFSMRGAKNAVRRMKNDPNDWLPADFPETVELKWFAKHFIGEKFIVITWPGCTADDASFQLFVDKLALETKGPSDEKPPGPNSQVDDSQADDSQAGDSQAGDLAGGNSQPGEDLKTGAAELDPDEHRRVRQMGDRLGLFWTGEHHENWGDRGEKWLQGHDGKWFFITPEGELYRWRGGDGMLESGIRTAKRLMGNKRVEGELQATLGKPSNEDYVNPYYRDPRRLTGRVFASITTGPQLLKQLSSPDGPLWPTLTDYDDEERALAVRSLAYERLTGSLFGKPPHLDFQWTTKDLLRLLPEKRLAELPEQWETIVTAFVEREGRDRLLESSGFEREWLWESMFDELGLAPPARQTCIIATLSQLGKGDMARIVGRPLLGKPRGVVLAIAEECGISTQDVGGQLRLGGPPVDNVAIDEEGTRTLVKLVGFSALLGFVLSYVCFRSLKITMMVFVVGGVSAVTGLAIVYFTGQTVDAIMMSMPAVVYVLGLSGAVHIVNYYRDSLEEWGEEAAPWRALAIGWWPCTLAAVTTAIGLMSLYASNIVPIAKFGLYSALGVLATLAMLFSYLPAALTMWSPKLRTELTEDDKHSFGTWLHGRVTAFWDEVGEFVIRRHALVSWSCALVMLVVGVGVFRINTSVKLMKLFDPNAKILHDYHWLEEHLGKLVPMEIVVRVAPDVLAQKEGAATAAADTEETQTELDRLLRYSTLERIEMADRVQKVVEAQFGPRGSDVVGQGMSAATFFKLPGPAPPASSFSRKGRTRAVMNMRLEESYDELLKLDYLRRDTEERHADSELWRVSLRLGALNDIDYGVFINDLRFVVEPVMSAYHYRDQILTGLYESDPESGYAKKKVLFLGLQQPVDPVNSGEPLASRSYETQTTICFSTLSDLLINKGFVRRYEPSWHDPSQPPAEGDKDLSELMNDADCVVLVRDHAAYDIEQLKSSPAVFLDARDHTFDIDIDGNATQLSAAQRNLPVQSIYTGAVPVIYKAQRTLLLSLMESIGWAFGLIALVMVFLLRSGRFTLTNMISLRGGAIAMLPNIFPVVLIFGAMGHIGVMVDIGTMMTASVAMGVAVDDTIHYLMWFRKGIQQGMTREQAIRNAYGHVATAMTQTTIIGGLGLSVFYLSTFTPTQRFGVMMLTLLTAALVGDLVFLPALLAGRLGRYFCPRNHDANTQLALEGGPASSGAAPARPEHSATAASGTSESAAAGPAATAGAGTARSRLSSKRGGRKLRKDHSH